MENKLKLEIDKQLEEAYRRGVSHGFEIGIKSIDDDYKQLRLKIHDWRYDLSKNLGTPGSGYENQKINWTDEMSFNLFLEQLNWETAINERICASGALK